MTAKTTNNGAVDQYAVFGNPIQHSRSPDIHRLFAEQTAQQLVYGRQQVPEDSFTQAADVFFAGGGKGLNITVPFKIDAFNYAHVLSERARRAGAVNTLAVQGNQIIGDNTDGVGMVRDISQNLGWNIKNKRVLVLGAGGAVRGVLAPLLAEKPQSLTIVNRTAAKAETLATLFADVATVSAGGYNSIRQQAFDLVINGTSASLEGKMPPLPEGILAAECCCYDMMYGAKPTVFMAWAAAQGASKCADGLGMLVEQAAESFALWRGLRPQTPAVMEYLRGEIAAS